MVTVDTVSGLMVVVSSADARYGFHRRLTHRRATLAFEAPIARPWISADRCRDGRYRPTTALLVGKDVGEISGKEIPRGGGAPRIDLAYSVREVAGDGDDRLLAELAGGCPVGSRASQAETRRSA